MILDTFPIFDTNNFTKNSLQKLFGGVCIQVF